MSCAFGQKCYDRDEAADWVRRQQARCWSFKWTAGVHTHMALPGRTAVARNLRANAVYEKIVDNVRDRGSQGFPLPAGPFISARIHHEETLCKTTLGKWTSKRSRS